MAPKKKVKRRRIDMGALPTDMKPKYNIPAIPDSFENVIKGLVTPAIKPMVFKKPMHRAKPDVSVRLKRGVSIREPRKDMELSLDPKPIPDTFENVIKALVKPVVPKKKEEEKGG